VASASELLSLFFQSYLGFFRAFGVIFSSGGWAVFLLLFFVILFKVYMETIRRKYIESLRWTFLQVRVPQENLRTPRAMEEVLHGLHGLQRPPDLIDTYIDGYVQSWLSLELRGTRDGVSFILRIPAGNQQQMEAAIYAQYPDAEIEEVADYALPYTNDRIEKDIDVWGTELMLSKPDPYPIKTYVDFEDQFAEEDRLVDPMAIMTEFLSALRPGEEIWIQILIRPVIDELPKWQKEGMTLALELAGRPVPKSATRIEKAFGLLGKALTVITTLAPGATAGEEKKEDVLGALKLTPGEIDIVRAIQRNVSKVGFQTKIRIVYVGPTAIFSRRLAQPIIYGMFRPFTAFNLNSFRPDNRVSVSRPTYGFVKIRQRRRKHRVLRKYRQRYFREKGYLLNVEELATVYHPPISSVKTPTLERSRAKKGEAPINVPIAPEELPLA
jgi:hypothetical protein